VELQRSGSGIAAVGRRLIVIASFSLIPAGCSAGATPSPSPSIPVGTSSAPASPGVGPDAIVESGMCSPAFEGVCSRVAVGHWHDVPYTQAVACSTADVGVTCQLAMDITAPTSGGPWPLIVFLPGGPSGPPERYVEILDPFAEALAGQGVVVMVAGWREGSDWGGGYPTSFADVACAIGVARKTAAAYGASPDRVMLVGGSTGGWPAAVVGLTPSPFTPAPGSCHPTAGSLRPDQVVIMAGNVNNVSDPDHGDGINYVTEFLGGDRKAHPHAWAAADPFALAKRFPAGAHAIPFLLIHGLLDTTVFPDVSQSFQAALVAASYHSRLVEIPGVSHLDLWGNGNAVTAIMTFVTGK
jgi:fermentation-respiration switch protein FrsA (DUF1100 family)